MIKPKVSRGNVKKVYKVKAPPIFVGREIKRKPKQIVASPTKTDTKIDKLVDQLLAPEAEARGLTLEEYKKVRQRELKAQQKYNEEHWVSPLLDGQIFALLTLKESKPYMYMGKPVSKSNEWIIDNYKQSNKGWLEYKRKLGKNKSAWEGMHIPPSIQLSQEHLIKTIKQIQKSVEPLRKTVEKIKSWNNPIASHLLPFGMLSSIQKEFPDTPKNKRLLRPAMVEALMEYVPTSKVEFLEMIPPYIRQGTDGREGKYLQQVFEIINTSLEDA